MTQVSRPDQHNEMQIQEQFTTNVMKIATIRSAQKVLQKSSKEKSFHPQREGGENQFQPATDIPFAITL